MKKILYLLTLMGFLWCSTYLGAEQAVLQGTQNSDRSSKTRLAQGYDVTKDPGLPTRNKSVDSEKLKGLIEGFSGGASQRVKPEKPQQTQPVAPIPQGYGNPYDQPGPKESPKGSSKDNTKTDPASPPSSVPQDIEKSLKHEEGK